MVAPGDALGRGLGRRQPGARGRPAGSGCRGRSNSAAAASRASPRRSSRRSSATTGCRSPRTSSRTRRSARRSSASARPTSSSRLLPPIARGELVFCQGFSEPGAGSDLGSLTTRAELRGDTYVVSGHKIWTSSAQLADWIYLAVRTDTAATKHRGITVLVCPVDAPGIEVRSFATLGGGALCEIFLDGVEIPVENVVGAVNGGWEILMYTLDFERVTAEKVGGAAWVLDALEERLRETDRLHGERVRVLRRLRGELHAARLLSFRALHMAAQIIEIAPGVDIEQLTDVALKHDEVQAGILIVERQFGYLEIHSRSTEAVRSASDAVLAALGAAADRRDRTQILASKVISRIDGQHAFLINRNKVGSMALPGESLFVLEVQPASYAIVATNEAEESRRHQGDRLPDDRRDRPGVPERHRGPGPRRRRCRARRTGG